jgi:hypothetical protein
MAAVTEAVEGLGNQVLPRALQELRGAPDRFPAMVETSSAAILVDRISAAYLKNFREMVTRFQEHPIPLRPITFGNILTKRCLGAKCPTLTGRLSPGRFGSISASVCAHEISANSVEIFN